MPPRSQMVNNLFYTIIIQQILFKLKTIYTFFLLDFIRQSRAFARKDFIPSPGPFSIAREGGLFFGDRHLYFRGTDIQFINLTKSYCGSRPFSRSFAFIRGSSPKNAKSCNRVLTIKNTEKARTSLLHPIRPIHPITPLLSPGFY